MSTLPRTAVLTFREAEPWVWMTSLVAMENLVVDAYDARVVTLRPRGGAIPRYLADRNGQRLLGARLGLPAYELVGADGPRVDVLVIICNDFFQLGRLETTPAFSRLADRIVVYIAEFWPDDAVLFTDS